MQFIWIWIDDFVHVCISLRYKGVLCLACIFAMPLDVFLVYYVSRFYKGN